HGAVFTGPEHEGFLCPKSSETPFSYDGAAPLAWGMPCFRRGAELTSRAFMPAEDLLRAVSALVPQEEAAAVEFLRNESNLRSLRKLTESFRERAGRYETEQEQEKRVLDVFEANRSVLSRELGHQARSFCWPWGANNSFSLEKGREAGFQVFYAVCPGPNPPGRPAHVKRFNAKRDIRKNFNRMRVYSRPWLGAFYQKIR
ncbi:MAG: hypothetical protein FWF99_06125, partial [Desulfovibrionaceae bacterium]|nr:hypothetical protein [Desulfovibrionaceae bacterium]